MRENKKVKRMSINEVKTVFSEIGKTEQALYVGRKKYTLDQNGNISSGVDDGSNFDNFFNHNGTKLLKSFPLGTWDNCQSGAATDAEGKAFFEFVANNSKVEWGMTIGSINGSRYAMVYTDHLAEKVYMKFNSSTVELIHSHKLDGDPGADDTAYARLYPQFTYKLYHNGYYKEYTGSSGPYGHY